MANRETTAFVKRVVVATPIRRLSAAPNGYTGSHGTPGNDGYTGSTGFVGSTGSTGINGFAGSVGFTGPAGASGFVGSSGTAGLQGFTGSGGVTGFTGSTGLPGFMGSGGFVGSMGFNGSNGFIGSAGFTGSGGSVGYSGSMGYGGSGGFAGSVGFTGSRGATNLAGISDAQPISFVRQSVPYTLNSTIATQKMFGETANGALTLAAGHYTFEVQASLSAMSATSGNLIWHLLGAGTAVIDEVMQYGTGRDGSGLETPGTWAAWIAVAETNGTSLTSATVQTALGMVIRGSFKVLTGGTLIPSVALSIASAAVVDKGSFMTATRLGPLGANQLGFN